MLLVTKRSSVGVLAFAFAAVCVPPLAHAQDREFELDGVVKVVYYAKSYFIIADIEQHPRQYFVNEKTRFIRAGKEVKFDALQPGNTVTVRRVSEPVSPPEPPSSTKEFASIVRIK